MISELVQAGMPMKCPSVWASFTSAGKMSFLASAVNSSSIGWTASLKFGSQTESRAATSKETLPEENSLESRLKSPS